jgi:pimeloyl-ACP methyl ester carboxylesterase
MAGDAVAVLDAVGVERAHIVGASMGGMIAQLVAVEHPGRVLSLTSIMSTTGNSMLPPARPEAMAALTAPISPQASLAEVLERGKMVSKAIGSPGYPSDDARLSERIERDFKRSFHPTGPARQMAAIVADGDRRERLAGVKAPTLVIHGADDPLVPVEGGRDTAEAIPGARIKEIPGMGHDLPLELVDEIAGAIAEHAKVTAKPSPKERRRPVLDTGQGCLGHVAEQNTWPGSKSGPTKCDCLAYIPQPSMRPRKIRTIAPRMEARQPAR